mgnify:CR=1 FL=1
MKQITKIAIFKGREVRKIIYDNEWWFSVIDVVAALTDSTQPSKYWTAMKARVSTEDGLQLSTICRQLKLESSDRKRYETDCASTEGIFRIIQSIPSPKAEPFRRWLAKVGYERVQEIEDPELATKRTRALYKAKGYPDSWIEKRMRGIEVRETLTDEWRKREVGGDRENLRDHMNDLELIFSMLGEASTTEIAKNKDTQGFDENKKAAREGGTISGNARRELEQKSGKKVSTKQNYLMPKPRLAKITRRV